MDGLILASRSPRRCELLSRLGLSFETDAPDVDESCSLPAEEAVQQLSLRPLLPPRLPQLLLRIRAATFSAPIHWFPFRTRLSENRRTNPMLSVC